MNYNKAEIERFLSKPDPAISALLFFGPDQGLAHERALIAIKSVLGGQEDPFRLSDLTLREIIEDPAKLADELNAIAMLGGRRVVRIAPAIDSRHNEALARMLDDLLLEHKGSERALLVVEAGDLPARHALVQVFADMSHAIAARCYRDSVQDLRTLIVDFLKQAGYGIERQALDYLIDHLGDDRGITRQELTKLCLYVGNEKKQIALSDVQAAIGDRSEIAEDDLMLAIAEGDLVRFGRCFARCLSDSDPIQLLRATSRYFMRLHFILGKMQTGESFERAASGLKPPLFWTVRDRIERQCRFWDFATLSRVLSRLIEAEAEAMRFYEIAETLCENALFAITRHAARNVARFRD